MRARARALDEECGDDVACVQSAGGRPNPKMEPGGRDGRGRVGRGRVAGHASVGWFERVLGCVKYSTWCACGRAGGHGRGRAPPCGRLRALEASNGFADASTRDGSTPSSSPVFALLL